MKHDNEGYEYIAKLCHQVNKAYCESIGDFSQPDWKDAPEWQRLSAINGAVYHIDNDNTGPEDSHDRWRAEKTTNGWKYGPVKNEALKEHPCMVDYNELPISQRSKDHIFKAICDYFKEMLEEEAAK